MTDFDFLVGDWTVLNRRRLNYVDPTSEWEEFTGHSTSRRLFDGGGNIEEMVCPTFSGITLRLFDVEKKEWSLNWSNSKHGVLTPPVIGTFTDGVGEFFGHDVYAGEEIYARFIWSDITENSAHWEQAFSRDGGQTWVTNWTMDFTRS
ncbi:hypothetical protein [Herbidospora mongoliensis]|uniref:hypothetical protein n=1 Tax=Herbidospora mongoliensis TaxID=688067 RepID=UPI00083659B7|nr:hypothetical protein [Herbidospora mongoliensis]